MEKVALPRTRSSLLVSTLLALSVILSGLLVSPAQSATPDAVAAGGSNPYGCKTIVRQFEVVDQNVKLRYAVWCSITQDRLYVTAHIQRVSDGVTHSNNKRCDNTYECVVTVLLYNQAGSQQYHAVGEDCLTGYPSCVTMVIHGNGTITDSSEMLPCNTPCIGGLVVRTKSF